MKTDRQYVHNSNWQAHPQIIELSTAIIIGQTYDTSAGSVKIRWIIWHQVGYVGSDGDYAGFIWWREWLL